MGQLFRLVTGICSICLIVSGLVNEYKGLSGLTALTQETEQTFQDNGATVQASSEAKKDERNLSIGSAETSTTSERAVPSSGDYERSQRGTNQNAHLTPNASTATILKTNEALPSIVVQLQGRLGNYLGKLAQGYGLKFWLEKEYGVETKIVLRHQERGFWVKGRDDLVNCFPKARNWDFEAANTKEFVALKSEQEEWLGNAMNPYTANETEINQYLIDFIRFLSHEKARPAVSEKDIGLPFLFADKISDLDIMVDRYFQEIQDLFEFDPACCNRKPDPDESVFVFRNFISELPRVGKSMGFEELNPNKTAYELFGNLDAGDKIAILTTDRNGTGVQEYVQAFQRRGLEARIVEPQQGIEDFCFLKSAKKELVGPARSTFVLWAGLLAEADRARPYSVNSAATRHWHQGRIPLEHYNFTNPRLASRMKFELFDA